MKRSITGFTIVELLIVIVVIAILAAISVVAYTGIQGRARDSGRIAMVNNIAKALEIYKLDNGEYPPIQDGSGAESSCGSQTENWGHCDRLRTLTDALSPYVQIDPTSLSSATQGNNYYYYTGDLPVDSGQSYGLMVYLEGDGGSDDGGYFSNAYEVGQNPAYCMNTYTGTDARWTWSWDGVTWGNTLRCHGGN